MPAEGSRRDVGNFLSVGSHVVPSLVWEEKEPEYVVYLRIVPRLVSESVFYRQGRPRRWFAKYPSAEDRTIAMIKRSGQYMHQVDRPEMISSDKIRLAAIGTLPPRRVEPLA